MYQLRTLFDETFLAEGTETAKLFEECGLVLGAITTNGPYTNTDRSCAMHDGSKPDLKLP